MDVLDECTDALTDDEVQEISKEVAARLCLEVDDVFDDEDIGNDDPIDLSEDSDE